MSHDYSALGNFYAGNRVFVASLFDSEGDPADIKLAPTPVRPELATWANKQWVENGAQGPFLAFIAGHRRIYLQGGENLSPSGLVDFMAAVTGLASGAFNGMTRSFN